MSRLGRRIARLETAAAPPGRCALCRDRPAILFPVYEVATRRWRALPPDTADPCPNCGWAPGVCFLVVISDREELEHWLREGGAIVRLGSRPYRLSGGEWKEHLP